MHRDNHVAGLFACARNIVSLVNRCRREHDIGVLRGRGPVRLDHDCRFKLLRAPRAFEPHRLRLMRKGISASPDEKPDRGVRDLFAIKVDHLPRVLNTVNETRDRDHAASLIGVRGRNRRHFRHRESGDIGARGRRVTG